MSYFGKSAKYWIERLSFSFFFVYSFPLAKFCAFLFAVTMNSTILSSPSPLSRNMAASTLVITLFTWAIPQGYCRHWMMVLSISHITCQMRPFIKKWKTMKYTTFIWTMFIQCLETDILLTSLPVHANQDSSSKAPDVIVTRPSKASWGKWNKLRAVSLFLQIQ